MITAPCSVCGRQMRAASPKAEDRLCSEPCKALFQYRAAGAERGAKPGDRDYTPSNPLQTSQHKRATRNKLRKLYD